MTATRLKGRCFWLHEAISPGEHDAPPLDGENRADVVIVGGGFVGLWTALELKGRDPAMDVAVVEADICGGGASGRATGQVLPQWVKIAALESLCGREGALALCHASAAAVADIERFCGSHGIEADFRWTPWLWGATCKAQMNSWRGVVEALAARSQSPMRTLTRDEIQAMMDMPGLLGGVLISGTATVQPAKLVRGLRRVALSKGVRVYEKSPMRRLERGPMPAVRTDRGVIRAERIVLAVNAWSARFRELAPAIVVIASDDAITAPLPELLESCRYIDKPQITDSQIFVTGFRTTPDGRLSGGVTGGQLGFAGLGANRFEGRSAREAAIRRMYERANPRLDGLQFVDSWAGPIDRTRSGLPLFGAFPGRPGVFYGYGFSGNGIATAPLAGRILASLATGETDQWSGCGLVRPADRWMPPEPVKFLGSLAVRAAIRRKDELGHAGRRPGGLTRALAALAPGGVVTTGKPSP